ncbi:MAG: 5-oxoprolinase subunit PxpB [Acidobacteria bacterium]|nr:5-oxoprolinase subunit PxpB [Acidobacteriota bacterium]
MIDLPKYEIFPLGESALTINFGDQIDPQINAIVTSLSEKIESNPFAGFLEAVPAYSSLTIFFDVIKIKRKFRNALSGFEIAKRRVEIAAETLKVKEAKKTGSIEIPVSFSPADSPDLGFVADKAKVSGDEVIEIFLSRYYRVYMLGFLPGFAYMGEIDQRIAVPRKTSPQLSVPKGSVGIAGLQTGVYPLDSPGGWQIIGRTDVELFTPAKNSLTLLSSGDTVKFIRK